MSQDWNIVAPTITVNAPTNSNKLRSNHSRESGRGIGLPRAAARLLRIPIAITSRAISERKPRNVAFICSPTRLTQDCFARNDCLHHTQPSNVQLLNLKARRSNVALSISIQVAAFRPVEPTMRQSILHPTKPASFAANVFNQEQFTSGFEHALHFLQTDDWLLDAAKD